MTSHIEKYVFLFLHHIIVFFLVILLQHIIQYKHIITDGSKLLKNVIDIHYDITVHYEITFKYQQIPYTSK